MYRVEFEEDVKDGDKTRDGLMNWITRERCNYVLVLELANK